MNIIFDFSNEIVCRCWLAVTTIATAIINAFLLKVYLVAGDMINGDLPFATLKKAGLVLMCAVGISLIMKGHRLFCFHILQLEQSFWFLWFITLVIMEALDGAWFEAKVGPWIEKIKSKI